MSSRVDQVSSIVNSLEAELKELKHEIGNLGATHTIPAAGEKCTVAEYLLERLKQIGVTVMFGLPGDFNLGFLDYVEADPVVRWAGNCNELNAAYAADGYARIKQKSIGVILTTFGVGELSAVNGISGAFAERVPVLHIVGVPSTIQQLPKPLLHHTLGNGRFDAYQQAYSQFVCTSANLMDENFAAREIDRVITATAVYAKPTYLMLPTDIVHKKISKAPLATPLNLDPPKDDPEVEKFVLDEIVKLVDAAERNVVILVDACAIRYGVKQELRAFAEATQFPIFAAPMGKTAISEEYERYGGVYDGSISRPAVRAVVENAKLLIYVGSVRSDYNTGNFSNTVPATRLVELHSDHTIVQSATFKDIRMKWLLPKLTERLSNIPGLREGARAIEVPKFTLPVPGPNDPTGAGQVIGQEYFWPRMGKFFKSGDIVVAETGTSAFGMMDVPFPDGATFVAQVLWGSIGWTVGSTLGVALAAQELNIPRVILFVGDGSMQLTFQELSTMQKLKVKPIIFLLNNQGYTIERYIHGMNAHYNDISDWKWTSLLSTLGGTEGKTCQSYKVTTKDELNKLLADEQFQRADKIQLVEVVMPMHDAPHTLKVQAEMSGITNKYTD